MRHIPNNREYLHALSLLTLNSANSDSAVPYVGSLSQQERGVFLGLANRNHVVIRALQSLHQSATAAGQAELVDWTTDVLTAERARISTALEILDSVCREMEIGGCPLSVLKSLDHTPDLGSDLDLYTTADKRAVMHVMVDKFKARIEPRSMGDCLANKWNFAIPGLREAVEVHVQRLGQTGEHTHLARRFVTRRVWKQIGGYTFPVPAPEETVLAATLQRMYRHFFFRICDIVNTAGLVEQQNPDYAELKEVADLGGIWPGLATYLRVVSDYVKKYRGTSLDVPQWVLSSALFGGEKIFCHGPFLHMPLLPQAVGLYTSQVAKTMLRGNLSATFRLSLLPPLFSFAAVHSKITGKDHGIW